MMSVSRCRISRLLRRMVLIMILILLLLLLLIALMRLILFRRAWVDLIGRRVRWFLTRKVAR